MSLALRQEVDNVTRLSHSSGPDVKVCGGRSLPASRQGNPNRGRPLTQPCSEPACRTGDPSGVWSSITLARTASSHSTVLESPR